MKIIFLLLVVMPLTTHAGAFEGIKKLIQSKEESSAKNDHKGKCENLAKESGPHEIIRKVDKDRYLAAVTVCQSRNNCSLGDALIVETSSWNFKGRTVLTTDLWVEPTGKRVNAKDENGFEADYALYKESPDCALDGTVAEYGDQALLVAIKNGDLELTKALVKKGYDINKRDGNGLTPLIGAIYKEHPSIAKFLIESGARVNDVHPESKDTALMTAAYSGQSEVVKLLIDKKANLEAKRDTGDTAISMAAMKGDIQSIKYLVDSGANINVQNNDGMNPILIATKNNFPDVVKYLKSKGADPLLKSKKGESALSFAKKSRRDIASILESK